MDEYLKILKRKIDGMPDEEIMYVLIPELMFTRDEAFRKKDTDKIKKIDEALEYIRQRMDYDGFYVGIPKISYDIDKLKRRKSKTRIPSPDQIINGESPEDVPNN